MIVTRGMFAALVRARRRPGTPLPRLKPMRQPDAVRQRYFARLRDTLLADLRAITAQEIEPVLAQLAAEGRRMTGKGTGREDAADDDFERALARARRRMADKWAREQFERLVSPYLQDAAQFHAGQMNAALEALAGVDVVGNEPWLADLLRAAARENVALISSIPSGYFDRIEQRVVQQYADGERAETMYDELQSAYGVSESRAKLIARDQIGKLNGDLNRIRQRDLGFERYTWRTMRDNRVRDKHEARDGKRYTWERPPTDGHPGQAIQCRCYAEPDVAHLLATERAAARAEPFQGPA